jgi:hypothetical protein
MAAMHYFFLFVYRKSVVAADRWKENLESLPIFASRLYLYWTKQRFFLRKVYLIGIGPHRLGSNLFHLVASACTQPRGVFEKVWRRWLRKVSQNQD